MSNHKYAWNHENKTTEKHFQNRDRQLLMLSNICGLWNIVQERSSCSKVSWKASQGSNGSSITTKLLNSPRNHACVTCFHHYYHISTNQWGNSFCNLLSHPFLNLQLNAIKMHYWLQQAFLNGMKPFGNEVSYVNNTMKWKQMMLTLWQKRQVQLWL